MKSYQDNIYLYSQLNGNDRCFECSDKLFEQFSVSINLGIFLCIRHSTQHIQYGRKISQIKEYNCNSWDDQNLEFIKQGGNIQFKNYLSLKGVKKIIFNKKFYSSDIVNRYRYLLEQKVLRVISIEDLNEIQGNQQKDEIQIEETKADLEKSQYGSDGFLESEIQSEVHSISDQEQITSQLNELQISNNPQQESLLFKIQDIDNNYSSELNKGLYYRNSSNYYDDQEIDGDIITLKYVKNDRIQQKEDNQQSKIFNSQNSQSQKLDQVQKNNNKKPSENDVQEIQKEEFQQISKQNKDDKQLDFKSSQSVNSLSSSSTSSSQSSLFINNLSKNFVEEKQKPSKKEQFFVFFSKAKEKYEDAKLSLKVGAKNLMYDINQKVQDPDTQIKIQMLKEDVRIKTMEAQEVIEEKATHLKDYASTALESIKKKIQDKIKEKKIDKEIVDMKQSIREKYLEFEVYTENLATKKFKQIKEYLHTDNIENEPFEAIESNNQENSQSLDQQGLPNQKKIHSTQNIQEIDEIEEQKSSLRQINENENKYMDNYYKQNDKKSLNQNIFQVTPSALNKQIENIFSMNKPDQYKVIQIQEEEDNSIFKSQEQNIKIQKDDQDNNLEEEEEEKKEKEEIEIQQQLQRNVLILTQDQQKIYNSINYSDKKRLNSDKVLFLDECTSENDHNQLEEESIFDSFSNQKV